MSIPNWVTPLFQSIDSKDTAGFLSCLADDVSFRFGNAEPVIGRAAVASMIEPFFQAVAGLQHEIHDAWEIDKTTIVKGDVTYTRHDGTTLKVPFANILKRPAGTIDEYLIYVDASMLFSG